MRKNLKKNTFLKRVFFILIIIILIIVGKNIILKFTNQNKQNELQILYNNEFLNLKNKPYMEDEVIYMSKEDIENFFDNTMYYDSENEELITTYNKHIAVLHLNKKDMILNDSNIEMQGELKENEGIMYLPISDLQIVYDLEIEYSDKTNIVIMDSLTKEKSQAIVVRNGNIKKDKKLWSSSVGKIKRGQYVCVIEDLGKYKKVRSEFGIIGYVRERKIGSTETLRENWNEEEAKESDFDNGFTINNESQDLGAYEKRNEVINDIYLKVISGEYYSVIIDFNNIDNIDDFYRFVIELTPKFNESGIKVAIKLNNQIEEQKVSNVVNYIIK